MYFGIKFHSKAQHKCIFTLPRRTGTWHELNTIKKTLFSHETTIQWKKCWATFAKHPKHHTGSTTTQSKSKNQVVALGCHDEQKEHIFKLFSCLLLSNSKHQRPPHWKKCKFAALPPPDSRERRHVVQNWQSFALRPSRQNKTPFYPFQSWSVIELCLNMSRLSLNWLQKAKWVKKKKKEEETSAR